jgi:hypothetical protein
MNRDRAGPSALAWSSWPCRVGLVELALSGRGRPLPLGQRPLPGSEALASNLRNGKRRTLMGPPLLV